MILLCDLTMLFNRGMMDKHILMSKSVDVATNRYAIAILKDGNYHIH